MADSIGHPELIIRNANIITIDPRRSRAQALAVQHGRFIAVGDDETVSRLAGPDTKVLNLAGKTVLPGFIDAHIHVLSSGIRHVMAADCDLPSVAAIQDALRERVQPRRRASGSRASSSTTLRRRKDGSCTGRTWMP